MNQRKFRPHFCVKLTCECETLSLGNKYNQLPVGVTVLLASMLSEVLCLKLTRQILALSGSQLSVLGSTDTPRMRQPRCPLRPSERPSGMSGRSILFSLDGTCSRNTLMLQSGYLVNPLKTLMMTPGRSSSLSCYIIIDTILFQVEKGPTCM